MEGRQLDLIWNYLGIFILEVTPMNTLGVTAKLMKFKYGNQFQY